MEIGVGMGERRKSAFQTAEIQEDDILEEVGFDEEEIEDEDTLINDEISRSDEHPILGQSGSGSMLKLPKGLSSQSSQGKIMT